MYTCRECSKEFTTQSALNAHQVAHKLGSRYDRVGRSRTVKYYSCLQCGKQCVHGSSKMNKFCDSKCKADWTWENVTKPRVENGECSHSAGTVLKKYLVETRGEICSECGLLPEWNGKPLVLQLDHIDGNSDNNYPKNLRLLCPNCHTQTETFGTKGQGKRYKKVTKRNKYLQDYKGSCVER